MKSVGKNVKTGPKQLRLDELGFSPKVAKVKVNLMLEERKGITVSLRTDDDLSQGAFGKSSSF